MDTQQTDIATKKSSELSNYKPVESLQLMARAEVAEKHYRQAKDTEGLHKAIEAIWKERDNFVRWWDAQNKGQGERTDLGLRDRPVTKLDTYNLSSKVVSRWRQKCGADVNTIIEQQYIRTIKIIDPDALADKHTGDEESYTPAKYIESARLVMGGIDLDPASNDMAQKTVKANRYFTVADNGLDQEWAGNVFMNPPYTALVINKFIAKVVSGYSAGDINQSIVLTNNNTDTSWFHLAASVATAICFTKGRINFDKRDGSTSSPTNGQSFFYFGDDLAGFTKEFSQWGLVVVRA